MFGTALCKFVSNQAGTIAVMTGLTMPVVIGAGGLGAEASYWYFNQRKLQNAADVAAYAGAVQLRADPSQQLVESAALAAAVETGYKTSIGAMTTSTPAVTGSFAGTPNTVEVTIQENMPRVLTSLFLSGDILVSGRAVALIKAGHPACILALHPTAAGAVTFTGSNSTELKGCNVHSNSLAADALSISGNAKVKTPCVSAVGNVSAGSGLSMSECNLPVEHADKLEDPYESVPMPPVTGACKAVNVFDGPPSATYSITEGRYCGGLTIKRTVDMDPGVYVVDGGELRIESSAVVEGSGVTFFLTNGATVHLAGTADVTLSAPAASSPYSGILFFVDRDDPYATHVFNGNASASFNGAIYAPKAHVEFAGSSTAGAGCTQIVARTVKFTGDAGIGSDCTGSGVKEINGDQLVVLVE